MSFQIRKLWSATVSLLDTLLGYEQALGCHLVRMRSSIVACREVAFTVAKKRHNADSMVGILPGYIDDLERFRGCFWFRADDSDGE